MQKTDNKKNTATKKVINEYSIGQRLAYLRNRKDLTQAKLADIADVSQSTIAQIESGGKDPSLTTLVKLAKALDIHEAVFLAGDGVHVFDMARLRKSYKKVADLNDTIYRGLGEVTRYAKDIGFMD